MMILASGSAARAAMLSAAGVPYVVDVAHVDEAAAKAGLAATGTAPRDVADALAELKALRVGARHASGLVLGSDSVVALADGTILDKPIDRDDAARQLARLSGRDHRLHSAAVIVEAGRPVWRAVESVTLSVRPLSDAFIAAYLDAEWPAIGGCVGGYRIEGRGATLFSAIEGSHFAILGLPLLPLLAYLRERGVMAS